MLKMGTLAHDKCRRAQHGIDMYARNCAKRRRVWRGPWREVACEHVHDPSLRHGGATGHNIEQSFHHDVKDLDGERALDAALDQLWRDARGYQSHLVG